MLSLLSQGENQTTNVLWADSPPFPSHVWFTHRKPLKCLEPRRVRVFWDPRPPRDLSAPAHSQKTLRGTPSRNCSSYCSGGNWLCRAPHGRPQVWLRPGPYVGLRRQWPCCVCRPGGVKCVKNGVRSFSCWGCAGLSALGKPCGKEGPGRLGEYSTPSRSQASAGVHNRHSC